MSEDEKSYRFEVCSLDEIQARKAMGFRFRHPQRGVHEIAVFWDAGRVYAIEDTCPHGLTSLLNGEILRGEVICPAHGASFDLATGKCTDGYTDDTQAYKVEVREGRVNIHVPNEEPL